MKVLIINNRGTIHAGAEVMISQLCVGLRKNGHEVRVLAGDEKGDGKNISDYSFRASLRSFYLFNPFAIFALWRVLRIYNPDIVHIHSVSKASPFILLLLKKIPTVLTIHDHTIFDPTRIVDTPLLVPYKKTFGGYFIDHFSVRYFLEKVRFYFYRRLAKNIDSVFACSNFYAKCAEGSGMFSKVRVLHNGIDLPEYKHFVNYNRLLFVGRLEDEKGAHVLLEAMPEVLRLRPDVRLDMVGAGNTVEKLKSQTRRKKIECCVFFHGYEAPHDVEKR
jgi:glycosyltransferase involved in cell wall biosynthesis